MKSYTIAELATQIEKACSVAERLDSIETELRAIRSAIEAIPRATAESDPSNKILLTFNQAAAALAVCRATVCQLVAQGYLRPSKIGRLTRFRKVDIEKLAKIGVPSVWGQKPWPEDRVRQ